MTEALIEAIDPFMDARSSLELPDDGELRKSLYGVLATKITEEWSEYTDIYDAFMSTVSEAQREAVVLAASRIQQFCGKVVQELEEAQKMGYSKEALFQAKELAIHFLSELEKVKKEFT